MNGTVRTSARGLIWREGKVLVTRNLDEIGDWFVLPGGGQHCGEDLVAACMRECLEEVGLVVEVGRLAFVREIIADNHQNTTMLPVGFHQIECIFLCRMVDASAEPCLGVEPDTPQTGVAWLSAEELGEVRFFPQAMVPHLVNGAAGCEFASAEGGAVYLGEVR